jgi:DNA repair protein RecN (Recombination protein N)
MNGRFRRNALLAVMALAAVLVPWLGQVYYPWPYQQVFLAAAGRYGLSPYLLAAVARSESRFDPSATSRRGAVGMMQVMPETGQYVTHTGSRKALPALRQPGASVEIGARYLRELVAEVADLTSDARSLGERLQDDPQRLAEIGARRKLLGDLRRKYGESLAEVMAYAERARLRREELLSFEERAQALETQRRHAEAELVACEEALGRARRAAAPEFSAKVQHRLGELAMPRARLEVVVEGRAGEEVCWMLGANPGEPTLPLAKVASGGELARAMLAARLVLGDSGAEVGWRRKTLVFDEVDAGIGGEAALAVGRALAVLAQHHQVLVVTHLAQVAAFADHHLQVSKKVGKGRTVARLVALEGEERLVELSRMLSGSPNSSAARTHAGELLARRALVRPFPTPSALP